MTSKTAWTSSEMSLLFFIINSQQLFKINHRLLKVITLTKRVLTILKLNWSQRFAGKKTKLNICHHTPTASTKLQNRSFTLCKERECLWNVQKWKMHVQSYYCFSFLPSSSCLLKLPICTMVTILRLLLFVSHSFSLTNYAKSRPVGAPYNLIQRMEDLLLCGHAVVKNI